MRSLPISLHMKPVLKRNYGLWHPTPKLLTSCTITRPSRFQLLRVYWHSARAGFWCLHENCTLYLLIWKINNVLSNFSHFHMKSNDAFVASCVMKSLLISLHDEARVGTESQVLCHWILPHAAVSLKCAHAFHCEEGLQNDHTSLKLSNFFATLHKQNKKNTWYWPLCIECEKNMMSHYIDWRRTCNEMMHWNCFRFPT